MVKYTKIICFILLTFNWGCQINSKSDDKEKYEKQLAKTVDSLNTIHNNERKQRTEERKIIVENKVKISTKAEELINKINNELKAFGKWGANSMVDITGCYFQVDPDVDYVLLRNDDIAVKVNKDKNRIYIRFDDIFSIGFRKGIYNISQPNEKRFFTLNFVVASNKSRNINDHYAFRLQVYEVGNSCLELYKDLVALTNMVSPILHYDDPNAGHETFKRPIKEVDETDNRFSYNF